VGPFPLLQQGACVVHRPNPGNRPIPFHIISNTHSTTPYTTLATVPNTITGPATTNILAAMPVTMPVADVNIGHSNLKNIYIKAVACYNKIK